jgi:hypothetical protein
VKSPDLNPIKHVWDALQRQIQQSDPAPPNTNGPEVALLGNGIAIPKGPSVYSFQVSPEDAGLLFRQEEATQSTDICWINCRFLLKQIMQLLEMEIHSN